jgi:hypothetical protein
MHKCAQSARRPMYCIAFARIRVYCILQRYNVLGKVCHHIPTDVTQKHETCTCYMYKPMHATIAYTTLLDSQNHATCQYKDIHFKRLATILRTCQCEPWQCIIGPTHVSSHAKHAQPCVFHKQHFMLCGERRIAAPVFRPLAEHVLPRSCSCFSSPYNCVHLVLI